MNNLKSILLTAITSFSFAVFAQKPIVVSVFPRPMSTDTQRSFVVEIPQTTLKDSKKDWLKYLKTGSQGDASEVNGVNFQGAAVNKNISADPFNVFSKLTETTTGVRLSVWLDEKNISRDPDNGQQFAMQKYVRDFAVKEYRQAVQGELKVEQDKQKALEKQLSGLIQGEEKSTKTVSENQRAAERSTDAIATNNNNIQNSNDKISTQKNNVANNAADPNASKGAKKTLAELETEKKDLQKKNETQGKKMDNMNKSNRAEERNMANSRENQTAKMTALQKQKQIVREVQNKLDNIK